MEKINILIAGDFCPILRIEELSLNNQPEMVFNDILEDIRNNDLNIVDLECPLYDTGEPIKKSGPNIKAAPHTVKLLKFADIQLVAMANNHIKDYGDDGLEKTKLLCTENGIDTVGVGKDLDAARRPFIIDIKGKRISILNMTENEWSNSYGNQAGANPLDIIDNFNDIKKAKEYSDIVVVIFHGGNEFYNLPSPRVKKTLRFFADAGADAVISHHTHVISGYEVYNGVPIFYSLGNFCYDFIQKPNDGWDKGYMVKLIFSETIDFEIIPFIQNSIKPGIHKLAGNDKVKFLEKIDALNQIILDDALLENHFNMYCRENAYRYDLIFEPYHSKILSSLRKRQLIPSLLSKRKKRLFLNIIRCDAHRDILLAYLSKYK